MGGVLKEKYAWLVGVMPGEDHPIHPNPSKISAKTHHIDQEIGFSGPISFDKVSVNEMP